MVKEILVLANSWKHEPSRCVAGRKIRDDGGTYSIHKWIRPVGTGQEGALLPNEFWLDIGRSVRVWDFVEISFSGKQNDPGQPENRLIDGAKWKLIKKYQRPPLTHLIETPANLWLEPGVKTDRVSAAYLFANPPQFSLACIKPSKAALAFFTDGWGKQKKRVYFTYNGAHYDLGLTDPVAVSQHCPKIPAQGEPALEVQLDVSNMALCVSLPGPFNGFHYKLVATILQ